MAWLQMQWDEPSRTDCYLMQIAYETRLANQRMKKGAKVKFKDFLLKFTAAAKSAPVTPEQAVAWAKARWRARMGKPIETTDPNVRLG